MTGRSELLFRKRLWRELLLRSADSSVTQAAIHDDGLAGHALVACQLDRHSSQVLDIDNELERSPILHGRDLLGRESGGPTREKQTWRQRIYADIWRKRHGKAGREVNQ